MPFKALIIVFCVALFAYLRPNDTMLSITGLPYDTLHEVIGIVPNNSSLASFGVKYDQIDLVDNDFDYNKIAEVVGGGGHKMAAGGKLTGTFKETKEVLINIVKKVFN